MTIWQNQQRVNKTQTTLTILHKGKYSLEKKLGVGVFSSTYLGTDQHTMRPVVLKTLAPSLQGHPDYLQFKQQFHHTALQLQQCQHPHLVSVIDYFEEQDLPFLVMDYVPGQSLAELLVAGTVLPPEKAVHFIRQVGAALQVMHDRGLGHGDVRPANIIYLPETEDVVLTDVGIVCNFTLGIRQTYANLLLAGYASPAYYSGDFTPKPADDLYALAATLYCFLTGQPPAIAGLNSTPTEVKAVKMDRRLWQVIFDFGLQTAEWRSPNIKTWLTLLPEHPDTATTSALAAPPAEPKPAVQKSPAQKSRKSPLKLLMFTGAIAGALGIGFGLVVRVYRPILPGDSILHTEQSFPPRQNWPVSESGL